MTPQQIDKKARQLYYRKRLIETVEGLQEAIKTFMAVEGTNEIQTSRFTIRLVEGELAITIKPSTDPNQLTFYFVENTTEPKFKTKGGTNHEATDPKKTITGKSRLSQRGHSETRPTSNP